MTIETTTSRVSYAGDGVSTVLPVSFPFQVKADLVVKLYNTETGAITDQTLTTHYTISGTLDPDFGYPDGGSVTMITPAPLLTNVVIYRDPSALQSLSIPTSGQLPSKPIEKQLDLTTMIVQRVNDVADRSVALPDGFSGTFDPQLPATVALNGGAALIINSGGTGFDIGPDTTQIAAAAAAAASSSVYSWYGTAGGTANALTLTPATALTGYSTGIRIAFIASATNTTAATLNISGLGVKSIKTQLGVALSAGYITSGRVYTVTYNGTDFIAAETLVVDTSLLADNAITAVKITDGVVSRNKLDTTTTQSADQFDNITLGASFAANAMTVSAFSKAGTAFSSTDYANVSFRSATLGSGVFVTRKLSAAISTVISSGSTAGFTSAVSGRLHFALIDFGGTVELAWCGTQLFDNSALITTTAEGGAGGADSSSTIYSTTARSNVACKYLGYMDLTQATAGTWVTAPSKIRVTGQPPLPRSEVWLGTDNGYGSSSTTVRRFSTIRKNIGTAISYADSATLGAVFNIMEDGVYAVTAVQGYNAAANFVISLNSTQLTTAPDLITTANIIAAATTGGAAYLHTLSVTLNLVTGDALRIQAAATPSSGTWGNAFRIVKVA